MKLSYSQATIDTIVEAANTLTNASVPDIAFATGISAVIINDMLLNKTEGQALVQAGKIALPRRGRAPKWASSTGAKPLARGSKVKCTISASSVATAVLAKLPPEAAAVASDLRTIIEKAVEANFLRNTFAAKKESVKAVDRMAQGVGENYTSSIALLSQRLESIEQRMLLITAGASANAANG